MGAPRLQIVEDDFKRVLTHLKERGLIPDPIPESMNAHARAIHASTYSLILWKYRFKKLPTHGRVYLDELSSDALQILPQVVLGFDKTTQLLCRGILENTLRHIYFSDHPIEFARTNRERWFLNFEELFQYTKIHPTFMATEKLYPAISRMKDLYAKLSAAVHGRAVNDLEMRTALRQITYTKENAGKQVEMVRRVSQAANFALAVFHIGLVQKLGDSDRRIILRGMEPPGRKAWVDFSAH